MDQLQEDFLSSETELTIDNEASGYLVETSRWAKQPFYITRRDGLPIAFAGLWENAKELHGTAAIVTTAASEETQPIHDRMPVILEKPDFPRWLASQSLTKQEAESLLRPSPAGSLVARPVSSRVNNVRNDDASLIDEIQSSSGLIDI